MKKSALLLCLMASIVALTSATPKVSLMDRNATTQAVMGFSDGFLGEKVEDMGLCGSITVDVILKY